jgi:hypothetical protein
MTSYHQYLKLEVPDERHVDRMRWYYTRFAHWGHFAEPSGVPCPMRSWRIGYHGRYPSPGIQDGHLGRVDKVAASAEAILQPTAALSFDQKAKGARAKAAGAYSRATGASSIRSREFQTARESWRVSREVVLRAARKQWSALPAGITSPSLRIVSYAVRS